MSVLASVVPVVARRGILVTPSRLFKVDGVHLNDRSDVDSYASRVDGMADEAKTKYVSPAKELRQRNVQ